MLPHLTLRLSPLSFHKIALPSSSLGFPDMWIPLPLYSHQMWGDDALNDMVSGWSVPATCGQLANSLVH